MHGNILTFCKYFFIYILETKRPETGPSGTSSWPIKYPKRMSGLLKPPAVNTVPKMGKIDSFYNMYFFNWGLPVAHPMS